MCDPITAQCRCLSPFITGKKCQKCIDGMYNLELGCKLKCQCDTFGSIGPTCDLETGQCKCKPKIGGLKCTICEPGYYNITQIGCLSQCDCDLIGSENQFCSSINGQCLCKPGYAGRRCDECANGFWRENNTINCKKCNCNLNGIVSLNKICDQVIIILKLL